MNREFEIKRTYVEEIEIEDSVRANLILVIEAALISSLSTDSKTSENNDFSTKWKHLEFVSRKDV